MNCLPTVALSEGGNLVPDLIRDTLRFNFQINVLFKSLKIYCYKSETPQAI